MRSVVAFFISLIVSAMLFTPLAFMAYDGLKEFTFTAKEQTASTISPTDKNDPSYKDPTSKKPVGAGEETDETVQENVEDIVLPEGSEEEATFLFIGTDYQPSVIKYNGTGTDKRVVSADAILLLKIDRKTKTFLFSSIPADAVMNQSTNKTLSQLYREKGASYIVDCVYALTGIQAEHLAVISVEDCVKAFKKIGNITYNVPCDMKDEEEWQNYKIDLKAGTQTLSPNQVVSMLRFKDYPENSTYTREKLLTNFTQALFAHLTKPAYFKTSSDLFSDAIGYFETNFTIEDFTDHLDLLFSYPNYRSVSVTYPGYRKNVYGKQVFVPSISEAISAYEEFK